MFAATMNGNGQNAPSTDATAIWLGHNWMQLFLASWVSRNNPSDTPVSQLKDIYTNIETTLPFSDVCRELSLSYRFPGCGITAQEDLYLFLGRFYEESLDIGTAKLDNIQLILSQYLTQLRSKPSPSPLSSLSSKPMTPSSIIPSGLPSTAMLSAVPSVLDQPHHLQMVQVKEGSVRSASSGPVSMPHTPSEDLAWYTSSLKARGDAERIKPGYDEVMLQETPPVWRCIGSYNGVIGEGMGSTKKEARHLASRAICAQLP